MIPHLLSKYILNQSDRIMITQFCGASDTGLYSLAYSCAMIPIMLGTATNIAWSPWSSEKIHENEFSKVRKASYYYITLFYIVIIGILLLGPEVVYILGGQKYAQAKFVLPPVVMGAAFQFLYNLYVALEQFAKKTVGMAIGTVLAAAINIALNWLLIPKYGYIAAAYTTLFGYACLLVIHYLLARKTGYIEAYNTKFIFASLGILMCLIPLSLWLYSKTPVIRFALTGVVLACAVVFVVKKRELVLKIIKR